MASIETRKTTKGTSYKVVWYDPDGHKRSKTWADHGRAELWKNLIEAVGGDANEAVQHLARQSSQARTVDQVSEHRLGLIRATPFTKQTYRSYMKNHISPYMGDWPVDTVTEDDCGRFIISLESKGLAPKTIHNISGWLTSIMGHADDRGWRDGNPVKPEYLPEVTLSDEQEEHKFLTRAEAFAIIERMPEPYNLPASLILSTGMRPSEMRALKVSDVHLGAAQPVVRVTKAIKRDNVNGEWIGPPKSKQANRSLGLPPSIIPLLTAHVAGRSTDEHLFPGAVNAWMSADSFSKAFAQGVAGAKKARLLYKNPTPYSLRHTHASLMIEAGMDIYALSRHLGHASVTMTEKVYLHLYPSAVFKAAEMAEIAIGALPQIGSAA